MSEVKRVLCIGHSHIGAYIFACREIPRPDVSFQFVNLLDARYISDGNIIHLDEIREDVLAKAADADAVVLSLSGNEHHVLGMVAPERPFDFFLPGLGEPNIVPGHEMLPLGLVRGTLDRLTSKIYYELFSGLFELPVYSVSPPPPILDETHIMAYPGAYKDAIAEHGINPPWLRLKLWQLYCSLAEQWSADAGFQFVQVPSSSIGPEGYLHYAALTHDSTHANGWYGNNMINHLLAHMERIDG